MKRAGILLTAVICLFLCGCTRLDDVRLRLVVHAVGIDIQEEDILAVSYQVFTAQPPEGGGPVDATGKNVITITAYGRTVYEAQRQLERQTGKEVFIGDAELIVLGDSFINRDISDVLSYFWGSSGIYMGVNVALADGKASDVVGVELEHGTATTELLNEMIDAAVNDGCTIPARLISVSNSLGDQGSSFIMPVITAKELKPESDSEIVSMNDTAVGVFKNVIVTDGKPSEYAGNDQVRGICLLTGKCRTMPLELDVDGNRVSVKVEDIKTKRRIEISGSLPVISADIRGSIKIADNPHKLDDEKIRLAACEELMRLCGIAYENTAAKSGVDVLDITRLLKSRRRSYYDKNAGMINDIVKNTSYSISVRLNSYRDSRGSIVN